MRQRKHSRRQALALGIGLAVSGHPVAALAARRSAGERALSFLHRHTGESITAVYHAEGAYLEEGLRQVSYLLRDFRNDQVADIDRKLLDLLWSLQQHLESGAPFHVISGYRSPETNGMLAAKSGGVAKKSLHMQGKAIDVAVPDRKLETVRAAALDLEAGGVGDYPKSGFVHLDTGRVRRW